jgi:hypothetical protein
MDILRLLGLYTWILLRDVMPRRSVILQAIRVMKLKKVIKMRPCSLILANGGLDSYKIIFSGEHKCLLLMTRVSMGAAEFVRIPGDAWW